MFMSRPDFKKYEALLIEKGLTSYQVSKKSGVNSSTFTDWKKGRSYPKREKLEKIAAALDVSPEFFFDEPVVDSGVHDFLIMPEGMTPILVELIDAARGCEDEDIRLAAAQLRRSKRISNYVARPLDEQKGDADV